MSSIADILSGKKYDEPTEVRIIKDFVQQKFQMSVGIQVNDKQIIISAPSAALIGTLRMHGHELAEACQTDKRLVFRIGS